MAYSGKKPSLADTTFGVSPPKRFADAQSYCVFPARETGLALRILDSSNTASSTGFKDTFFSRTKSLWSEIQSVQQKLKAVLVAQPKKTGPNNHVVLGDLQDVLITGVALHLPHLKDAVLVVGQLMDLKRYPQDPLGFRGAAETALPFWDQNLNTIGNIRFWIFDRTLIAENKMALQWVEKGPPGLTSIAILRDEKLDAAMLRRCDFTHSLGRLLDLYTPWAEAYFPKFQIYHPDLDMFWGERDKDHKTAVHLYEAHHRQVFGEKGITCCEMLVLPSAMELLSAMLSLAANQQAEGDLAKQHKEPKPGDETKPRFRFLFEHDTLLDLHESFKRLAHFFDRNTQTTFGNADHAPYLTAPKWSLPEHIKPATIADAVADNLDYGIDTCGEDITSPDFSPVKHGFELNKTQACGLFEKLTECLVKQIQNEGTLETDESRKESEQLKALEQTLIAQKHAGPAIWVSVRVEIEKALLRQKKMKFGLSPGSPIPPIATQVRVGLKRLFTCKGLTLDLFGNELQAAPYTWMTPFMQAPVSTCVKIQLDFTHFQGTQGKTTDNIATAAFHASELPIKRLSLLANVFDSNSDPSQNPFVESGFYTPQAVYETPEDAREALELILEMSASGAQELSLLTLSMAKTEDWLSFLATTSLHAKAVLYDERIRVY